MERFNPVIEVPPDGLYTPEVRAWSLEKYRLVGSYCDIFTTGMRQQWNQLVYIDLFAGAGLAKIKESGKTYKNSAFTAMSIPYAFTKYILCEQDEERFEALSARVKKDYSHLNIELIKGDSNQNVDKVLKAIPPYKKGNTLLPFCFVDPYSLNLNFSTIQALSKNLMDFLILQALHMDANRNFEKYLKEESKTIENYIGIPDWRELYDAGGTKYKGDFVRFLADSYQDQMHKMGYEKEKHMQQIKSNVKNLSLYYLAFYSKNKRGIDFFKKIQQSANHQYGLALKF